MIDSTTVFDRVRILYFSDEHAFAGSLYNGVDAVHVEDLPRYPWLTSNAEVAEVVSRVKAGTATVEYQTTAGDFAYDAVPPQMSYINESHPFHPNDSYKIADSLIKQGDLIVDSDTDQPTIQYEGGIETGDFTPVTSFTQSTSDWFISPLTSTRFQFDLPMNAADGWTTSNLGNNPHIKAFIATLRAIRQDGVAIPAAVDFGTSLDLRDRTYRITFPDASVVNFRIIQYNASYQGGHLIELGYVAEVYTPSTAYDTDALDAYLNTNERVITSTGTTVKSPIGTYTQPLKASEIDFGNGNKIAFENGSRVTYVNKGAVVRRVAEGNDLILALSDLAVEGGFRTFPRPQDFPLHNTLHLSGLTADAVVRSRIPALMSGFVDNHRPFVVHNKDAAFRGILENHDGTNIVSLRPGERAEIFYTYADDGGGELIAVLPERFAIAALGEGGTLSTPPHYDFDATNWARPFVAPTLSQYERFDDDAFSIGTATWTAGASWSPANAAASQYTIEVLKAGEVRFQKGVDVSVQGSGELAGDMYIQLFILRSGAWLTTPAIHYNALTGTNTFRTFLFDHVYPAQAGDVLHPLLIFPKTSSLSTNDVRVESHWMDLTLVSRVVLPHTP